MAKWTEAIFREADEMKRGGMSYDDIARNLTSRTDFTFTSESVRWQFRKKRDNTKEEVKEDKARLTKDDTLRELQRKYKATLRDMTFEERIIAAIDETCGSFDYTPPPEPAPSNSTITEETAVIELSDWHFGEIVSAADTGGLAEYNMDVAARRLQYLADAVRDIKQSKLQGYKIDKVCIFLLGDFASTNIHKLLQHSIYTPVDSLLIGGYLLAQFLLDMARIFPSVEVDCVVGNHGRVEEKKQYQQRYCNWDYVMYNQLSFMLLFQSNITFNFPRSFWLLKEIEGWRFLLLHGDDIRMWNQIPWYGILRALRNFQELLNARDIIFDNVALGHFHNTGVLDRCRGEILLNGSGIGPTSFGVGSLFTGTPPKQLFFGVHHKQGVSWRYRLNLNHVPADMQMRYNFSMERQINHQLLELIA